jgi:hypothetical protein
MSSETTKPEAKSKEKITDSVKKFFLMADGYASIVM